MSIYRPVPWGKRKPPTSTKNASSLALASGLNAHWLMGEGSGSTLYDSGPHGIPATMTLSTSWAAGNFGAPAPGLGTSNNIATVAATFNAYCSPTPISVSFWLKTNGTPAQYQSPCGSTNGDTWNSGWGCYWNSGTVLRFFIQNYLTPASVTIATPTNWNFIVGTWDRATIRMYCNSIEGTSTGYASGMDTTNQLLLGTMGNTNWQLPCKMESFRVYNRVLTPNDIQQLYTTPFADLAMRRFFVAAPAAVGGAANRPVLVGGRLVNYGLTTRGLAA